MAGGQRDDGSIEKYPSDDAAVPDLTRKPLEHVLVWR